MQLNIFASMHDQQMSFVCNKEFVKKLLVKSAEKSCWKVKRSIWKQSVI